jgi:hypothetical protein
MGWVQSDRAHESADALRLGQRGPSHLGKRAAFRVLFSCRPSRAAMPLARLVHQSVKKDQGWFPAVVETQ